MDLQNFHDVNTRLEPVRRMLDDLKAVVAMVDEAVRLEGEVHEQLQGLNAEFAACQADFEQFKIDEQATRKALEAAHHNRMLRLDDDFAAMEEEVKGLKAERDQAQADCDRLVEARKAMIDQLKGLVS